MAKIGIVGHLGVVGSAIKYCFDSLDHEVKGHDVRSNTQLSDLLYTETIYLCVPTPSLPDGSCNTSIIENIIADLNRIEYEGVIAIKSTCAPGFTQSMIDKWNNPRICHNPEVLRERAAFEDATTRMDVCVVGTHNQQVYDTVKGHYGAYPKSCFQLKPIESELFKYMNNLYGSTLITLANSFYEICLVLGADYNKVKSALVGRNYINDVYLDANPELRGFGGPCLGKDTREMAALCRRKNLNVEFFADLLKENSKYKTTVLPGMRPE